jgi:hypothetical protein
MLLDCWRCHCQTVVCCVVHEVHDPQAIDPLCSFRTMVLPFFVIRTSSAVNIAAHPWSQNFVTEMSEYSVSARNKCLAVATSGSPHGGILSCPSYMCRRHCGSCWHVTVYGHCGWSNILTWCWNARKWPVVLVSMIAVCRSGGLGGSCSQLESK